MKKLISAADAIAERIRALLAEKERLTVAIDGRCAAGKSSLAALLREALGCTVIHADDFFLRPEQRTSERLAEVGGNLDRERLLAEVLIPLSKGLPVKYRPFDCKNMTLGEAISLKKARLTVIEGSYSMHPALSPYYDLSVFLTVDSEEQARRLLCREGEEKFAIFRDRWIPLEEKYFAATECKSRCEIVFKT